MNVIGNLEKEEVEEEKKKQDSPLNPISPDEDYANDPKSGVKPPRTPTSARAPLINVSIYPAGLPASAHNVRSIRSN